MKGWRISVPILVLTLGFVWVVQANATPRYSASGTVMLSPPSLAPMRTSDAGSIDLEEVMAEFAAASRDEGRISPSGSSVAGHLVDASVIEFSAEGSAALDVERALGEALEWLDLELERRQSLIDVIPADRLQSRLLTPNIVARARPGGGYIGDAIVWVDGIDGPEENPYDPSSTTMRLLTIGLLEGDDRQLIENRIGPETDYTIYQQRADDIAAATILVQGPTRAGVLAAFDEIVTVLDLQLEARQARAGVPPARRIFVDALAPPTQVDDVTPRVQSASVVVLLLGVGLAGGLSALLWRRGAVPEADGRGDPGPLQMEWPIDARHP
jgi:hypothetical protein